MAIDADTTDVELNDACAPPPRDDDRPADGVDSAAEDADSDDAAPPLGIPTGSVRTGASAGARLAIAVGLVAVVMLSSVAGWLGYRAHEARRAQQERNLLLQAGRQGALNLTTIDYARADADVQRILDGAAGSFRADFDARSKPFVEVVKQAQSRSEGRITEAAVESDDGDHARILVAVTVKTSLAGVSEPRPRDWRMRIDVQNTDRGAKVTDVEFIP